MKHTLAIIAVSAALISCAAERLRDHDLLALLSETKLTGTGQPAAVRAEYLCGAALGYYALGMTNDAVACRRELAALTNAPVHLAKVFARTELLGDCPACKGKGYHSRTCYRCEGKGKAEVMKGSVTKCIVCNGYGRLGDRCATCRQTGRYGWDADTCARLCLALFEGVSENRRAHAASLDIMVLRAKEGAATAEAERAVVDGVPASVYAQIRAAAVRDWPSDYVMQKFVIEQQVKAYKDLHAP
jgi:hypothetical protein